MNLPKPDSHSLDESLSAKEHIAHEVVNVLCTQYIHVTLEEHITNFQQAIVPRQQGKHGMSPAIRITLQVLQEGNHDLHMLNDILHLTLTILEANQAEIQTPTRSASRKKTMPSSTPTPVDEEIFRFDEMLNNVMNNDSDETEPPPTIADPGPPPTMRSNRHFSRERMKAITQEEESTAKNSPSSPPIASEGVNIIRPIAVEQKGLQESIPVSRGRWSMEKKHKVAQQFTEKFLLYRLKNSRKARQDLPQYVSMQDITSDARLFQVQRCNDIPSEFVESIINFAIYRYQQTLRVIKGQIHALHHDIVTVVQNPSNNSQDIREVKQFLSEDNITVNYFLALAESYPLLQPTVDAHPELFAPSNTLLSEPEDIQTVNDYILWNVTAIQLKNDHRFNGPRSTPPPRKRHKVANIKATEKGLFRPADLDRILAEHRAEKASIKQTTVGLTRPQNVETQAPAQKEPSSVELDPQRSMRLGRFEVNLSEFVFNEVMNQIKTHQRQGDYTEDPQLWVQAIAEEIKLYFETDVPRDKEERIKIQRGSDPRQRLYRNIAISCFRKAMGTTYSQASRGEFPLSAEQLYNSVCASMETLIKFVSTSPQTQQ